MKFLDHTWTWDWCRKNGFALTESEGPVAPRLADASALDHSERRVHAAAGERQAAQVLAARVTQALGAWDECLAWATDWDVWEQEEDWPRYYTWRARYGERRSVGAAPGHLFSAVDREALKEFVAHAIECGWDITLLPARSGRPTEVRARTSHDEWVEFRAREPLGLEPPPD